MNDVVVVSGERWRDSVIHTHVSILPQTPLPFKLAHNIEQSSICYTIGPAIFKMNNQQNSPFFEQAVFIGTQMGFCMPLAPTEISSFCSLHKKSSPSLAQSHWLKSYPLQYRSSQCLHMFLLRHKLIWNMEPSAKHPILASDVSRAETIQDFFCPRCCFCSGSSKLHYHIQVCMYSFIHLFSCQFIISYQREIMVF